MAKLKFMDVWPFDQVEAELFYIEHMANDEEIVDMLRKEGIEPEEAEKSIKRITDEAIADFRKSPRR